MEKIRKKNKRRFSSAEKAKRIQTLDDYGNKGPYPHWVIEQFFRFCNYKEPHRKFIHQSHLTISVDEFLAKYQLYKKYSVQGIRTILRWMQKAGLVPLQHKAYSQWKLVYMQREGLASQVHKAKTPWRIDPAMETMLLSAIAENPKLGKRRNTK